MTRLFKLSFLLAQLLVLSVWASAAIQTEPITSIFHGGTPFMVATKLGTKKTNSTDEYTPGLYRKEKGHWDLAFPGHILLDDRKGPFVHQLALTKTDDRFDSLAVIDGTLTLFSVLSKATDKESFFQFGSQETPLMEIDSQQKRFLPPLKNTKNISIFQVDNIDKNGSQAVLVSIKFDQQTPIGKALTFVFGVKPAADKVKMELVGVPVVLDHKFHDVTELHGLLSLQNGDLFIFSETLLNGLMNADLRPFGKNEEFIRNVYLGPLKKQFLSSQKIGTINQLISFNFTQQEIHDDSEMEVRNNIINLQVTERAHVKKGSQSVSVGFNNFDYTINGLIDRFNNHLESPKMWTSISTNKHGIFLVDENLYFVNHTSPIHKPLIIKLGTLSEILGLDKKEKFTIDYPRDFFFATFEKKSDEKTDIAVVLSVRNVTKEIAATKLIGLRIYNEETIVSRGVYPLVNFFLSTDSVIERSKENGPGTVLFDILTGFQKSTAAYKQAYDPSTPHISLLDSVNQQKIIYKYNKPIDVERIKEGISFARFSPVDNIPNPTGLYFYNSKDVDITGNEPNRVLGQLLKKESKFAPELEHPYLAHYEIKNIKWGRNADDIDLDFDTVKSGDNREVYVFAIDASFEGGTKGYNLVIATNFGQPLQKYLYKTMSMTTGVWQDFETLKDVAFVRGRHGPHEDFVAIVVSFRTKNGLEKTVYFPVSLKNFDKSIVTQNNIEDIFITTKELGDRVGYDDMGAPYFVLTPELGQDSTNFRIMSLVEGRTMYPNQSYTTKKLNLKIGTKLASDLTYYVPIKDSWRKHPAEIEKAFKSSRIREVEEFESFIDLKHQLNVLSNPDEEPQHTILVVPQSLRNLVWDFILELYMSPDGNKQSHNFSRSNRSLLLNVFDYAKGSQEQFFENIKAMNLSKESGERSFLLGRLDEIFKEKFPDSENGNPFNIVDIVSNRSGDITDVTSESQWRLPHALYLLAAHGAVPLAEFRKTPPKPLYSSVILATPEEMHQMDVEAPSEIDAGMLKTFTIKEIKNPDQESMAASIVRIFDSPEVKSLDYKFSGQEIRPRSALRDDENLVVIVDYAISRFNALVEQKKQNLFESFMRFRSAFAAAVVSDRQARQSRLINKFFVERVLNQVFDIPLNLETLPVDDPIRILSRKDAVLKLQEAGYSGPFDLKTKVIRTVLSQTLADVGKPIPSSTILFGETGAGKTFMFTSLVKMLGLQLYDVNASANDNFNASAIIINVGKITDEAPKDDPYGMSVQKAILHLNTFLSLDNGYRGWILIDDVHAASDRVKAEILSWLRGTFEAPGGMYATTKGPRRPVRNLNVFMTLNPTADQEQIARFAKDKSKPTTEELLLATLSTSQFKIEPSFLRRWNSIINLNYMPVGAKGPELIKSLSEASKNLLNSRSKIAFVDPLIIRRLVNENEKLDARSFLSASTSSLIDMASHNETPGSVALIVPSMSSRMSMGLSPFSLDGSASEKIDTWVNNHTRALSLDSGLDGNLALMELILNAYRIPLYEFLIGAIQEDMRFSGEIQTQKTFLAPILAAISDHLQERPELPLAELHLKPSEFGMTTSAQRDVFHRAVDSLNQHHLTNDYFPPNFGKGGDNSSWKELYDSNHSDHNQMTRRSVILDTINLNRETTFKHLQSVLKVNDLDALPEPFQWLMQLTPNDNQALKKVGKSLANNLWDYFPKMFSENLSETSGNNVNDVLTVYGATRLFLYSIDKAVTRLPWVHVNRFILNCLDLITQDQVLSQKSGVQAFLFSDRYRLLKPTITDLVFQMIANSPVVDTIPSKTRETLRKRFSSDCETLLIPPNEL